MAENGLSHSQLMEKRYSGIDVDTAQTTLGGSQPHGYFSEFLSFVEALKKAGYEI